MHPSVSNTSTSPPTTLTYTSCASSASLTCSSGLPYTVLFSEGLCSFALQHSFYNGHMQLISFFVHCKSLSTSAYEPVYETYNDTLRIALQIWFAQAQNTIFHDIICLCFILQDHIESLGQLFKILFTDQNIYQFLFTSSSMVHTGLCKILLLLLKSCVERFFPLSKNSFYMRKNIAHGKICLICDYLFLQFAIKRCGI